MKRTPLEYGMLACRALMKQYMAEDLPPKDVFFYHQGVFLSGMQRIYDLTGNEEYFQYVKNYVDHVIGKNGEIVGFCHEITGKDTPDLAQRALTMLDHKQPGVLLYQLYERSGEKKYEIALKTLAQSMYYWPVNRYGGYWHMLTQPNQMWLDSAYMVGPLSVIYAQRYGDIVLRERAVKQLLLMNRYMKDERTGLYFHGWDASDYNKQAWADSETGLSGVIWGRAVGWYAVTLQDVLELLPENHPAIPRLKEISEELLEAIARYQDPKSGMWYQVTDKPGEKGNWIESSSSHLFIYSFAKALRRGIISEKYNQVLDRACDGMEKMLYFENGFLVIDHVCIGTCIDEGTYEHYINRQQCRNDLHGVGAFILMCAELEQYRIERKAKDREYSADKK